MIDFFYFELIYVSPHRTSTEHLIHVDDLCYVAFGQTLLKIFGNVEHVMHVNEFANSPLGQVSVEDTGLTEDKDHIGDLCHVTLPDRAVRYRGAVSHRLQFACVDSGYEIICVLWLKTAL